MQTASGPSVLRSWSRGGVRGGSCGTHLTPRASRHQCIFKVVGFRCCVSAGGAGLGWAGRGLWISLCLFFSHPLFCHRMALLQRWPQGGDVAGSKVSNSLCSSSREDVSPRRERCTPWTPFRVCSAAGGGS